MVKEIPLQNGLVALVDDEDYERVVKYIWSVYVNHETTLGVSSRINGKTTSLSRYILGCDDKVFIAFKDKNNLNFTRNNLLILDKKELSYMKKGRRNSTSKYKGVIWDKAREKWFVQIAVNKKSIFIGRYDKENDAARAYNQAALEYFGANAYQNIIGEDNSAATHETKKVSMLRSSKQALKDSYRGVRFTNSGRYRADLHARGKTYYLGVFDTAEEAAKAYDRKAIELHGEKAILNFQNEVTH